MGLFYETDHDSEEGHYPQFGVVVVRISDFGFQLFYIIRGLSEEVTNNVKKYFIFIYSYEFQIATTTQ